MLSEMTERGPDSAGIAVYRNPQKDGCKITILAQQQDFDWGVLEDAIKSKFALKNISITRNHAVLSLDSEIDEVQDWVNENWSDLSITSAGTNIEIFKGKGNPAEFIDQFDIKSMSGTHALGHTRMATESVAGRPRRVDREGTQEQPMATSPHERDQTERGSRSAESISRNDKQNREKCMGSRPPAST